MEDLRKFISEKIQRPYFEGTSSSKEFIAAKKFTENYIDSGKLSLELSDIPEHIEAIRKEIQNLGNRLMPNISIDGVIDELKKGGVIIPYVPEKIKKEKTIDFLPTTYIALQKPKQVEIDEERQYILEANLLLEDVEKKNIFKNEKELDDLYQKAIESDQGALENEEYYYAFSEAGLIKNGDDEVKKDLTHLAQLREKFNANEVEPSEGLRKMVDAKKIATITERSFAIAISEFHWLGENVTATPAPEFSDVMYGIDDVLEIKKEGEESTSIGLGIDVTFRGLESEQFKQKFFKLLQFIRNGHRTKLKYFTNSNNERMREFSIPKIVLYFNVDDVKDFADILRYRNIPEMRKKIEDDPQKFNVMRQIVSACRKLAVFAEESQNSIFRRYIAVINAFKELSWENSEIQQILESEQHDETSKRMDVLIEEFKLQESV